MLCLVAVRENPGIDGLLIGFTFEAWLMVAVRAVLMALRVVSSYVCELKGVAPSAVEIIDLDADMITGFLHHLEQVRGNSIRPRNPRLAALHSLSGYAALRRHEHAEVIQRVLTIPTARMQRNIATWLDPTEADALLGPATKIPATVAAITRCSRWQSRRGCESAKSSASPSPTCRRPRPLPRQGPQRTRHPLLPAQSQF